MAKRPFNSELFFQLNNLSNRGYTEGFYQRHPNQDYQNYLDNHSINNQQRFVGEIIEYDDTRGLAEVIVKNKFSVGDELELILPTGNRMITLDGMQDLKGNPMQEAPGGGYQVRIPLPQANYKQGLIAVRLG